MCHFEGNHLLVHVGAWKSIHDPAHGGNYNQSQKKLHKKASFTRFETTPKDLCALSNDLHANIVFC